MTYCRACGRTEDDEAGCWLCADVQLEWENDIEFHEGPGATFWVCVLISIVLWFIIVGWLINVAFG